VSTSADGARRSRLIGTRAEGLALLFATATICGCTWPQDKYLLSLLPPFTARGIPNLLGAAFAFAVALGSGDTLRPPRSEWRWVLIAGVLSGFAAAGLFGLGTVVAKKPPLAMHPVTGVAWQALFGALLVEALALFEHPDWRQLTPPASRFSAGMR
jgi:drug/metabolite transporter (DMT)-like permease